MQSMDKDLEQLLELQDMITKYDGNIELRNQKEYEQLKSKINEKLKQSEWFKIITDLMECDLIDNNSLGRLFQVLKSNKDKAEKYDSICDSSATEYMVKLEQQIKQLQWELEKYKRISESISINMVSLQNEDNRIIKLRDDEIQSLKSQLEERYKIFTQELNNKQGYFEGYVKKLHEDIDSLKYQNEKLQKELYGCCNQTIDGYG